MAGQLDRAPVLTGERLLLRPLEPDDWDALYAIASDRELWAIHPVPDRWQEPVFRRFFADALAEGGGLVAIERASGRVVGSSRYKPTNHPHEVEIGYTFLTRELWGSGLNAEMKRLMIAHALRFVERVVFRVGEDNWRSRRAMEKIGGRLTDTVERFARPDGGEIVHVMFEIDRPGFAEGPLNTTPSPRT